MSRSAALQGLGPTDVFCAKAKRQWQQHDVDHEGVITGRDGYGFFWKGVLELAQSRFQTRLCRGIIDKMPS